MPDTYARLVEVTSQEFSDRAAAIDDFFYDVYSLCFDHPDVPFAKKKTVLEKAADLGSASWPVVGVTEAALCRFVEQGNFKGIHRGHFGEFGRRDRALRILESKLTKEELLKDYRENDKTVLITAEEQHTEWSRVITVNDQNLFRGDGMVRVTTGNKEWAEKMLKEIHSQLLRAADSDA